MQIVWRKYNNFLLYGHIKIAKIFKIMIIFGNYFHYVRKNAYICPDILDRSIDDRQ